MPPHRHKHCPPASESHPRSVTTNGWLCCPPEVGSGAHISGEPITQLRSRPFSPARPSEWSSFSSLRLRLVGGGARRSSSSESLSMLLYTCGHRVCAGDRHQQPHLPKVFLASNAQELEPFLPFPPPYQVNNSRKRLFYWPDWASPLASRTSGPGVVLIVLVICRLSPFFLFSYR